jgi:hypothetical protein
MLFALQSATERNGSCSSHLLHGAHLPSPPFVLAKAKWQNTLFALPTLQSKEPDRGETLDRLQERLDLSDERLIELAMLDWLQVRIGSSEEKLAKLVQCQPTILSLSV